jgi:hypothetical protein
VTLQSSVWQLIANHAGQIETELNISRKQRAFHRSEFSLDILVAPQNRPGPDA